MPEPRRHVRHRSEDEPPLVVTGMGQREAPGARTPASERDEVEVDDAGAPADGPPPAERTFDPEEPTEKRLGRKAPDRERRDGVQKWALARTAHG